MKKIYFLLLIFSIIFAACKKNRDAELSTFLIQNEKIIPSSTSVELSCEVVCSATITELYLQYGTKADFSKCEEVRMKKGKSSYSVKIDNLTANTTYYVRYLAVNNYSSMISEKSSKFKTQAKSEPNEPDNPIDPLGREYVDLGLSVKWATCNVGATKPEEYGDYFAWGETALKSTFFGWDSYKFYDAVNGFTKYNQSDNRFTLDPEDDVAFMNWGGGWRMPTQSEIQELFEDCVWTSEIQNGVRGKKVVGPNGNAIFLPAGGYESDGENELIGYFGSYWSSSLGILNNWYYGCAYSLHFFASFDSVAVHLDGAYRRYGKSIRPVWGESRDNPDDNFNDNSTEMYMIGEDFGGWDWNNEGVVSLIPVHSAEGAFWTIKPLKAGKQFKFCSKKEWNGDFNSLGEDSGYVIVDGNCSVESDGIYMIYVDVKNKKLVIEPAAVYGIGDCFGSWDEAMRSAKFAVSEDGKVLIMTVPASGNLRMYAESSAATTDWWTREFNVYDGKIKFRGIGGDLEAVEVKAGQVVTINFSDNTATIIGKQYTITASSNNSSYGTVSGGGTYEEGTQVTLTATPKAGYKFTEWHDGNTDNPRIITVTQDESYTAVFVEKTMKDGHEYVDLGLPSGVKWATCNVGADSPDEYGDYFAWGETEIKSTFFGWESYKFYGTSGFTKYNSSDNKVVLDSGDDAATANWGGNWRMPTRTEFEELLENCTWTYYVAQNGVKGKKVVGPNGNYIFLPAGGYESGDENELIGYSGWYYTSSLAVRDNYYGCAYALHFYPVHFSPSLNDVSVTADNFYRRYGSSVRPVWGEKNKLSYTITVSSNSSSYGSVSGGGTYEEGTQVTLTATPKVGYKFIEWHDGNTDNPRVITVTQDKSYTAYFEKEEIMNAGHEFVDLGLPSGLKWATCNVGATKPEDYGDYFAWGEVEPKTTYNWSTYKYSNGSLSTLTKYCDNSSYGNNGFTDNKTVLDPEDDAAHVNWGGAWRMPTKAEQDELRNNCTWTWTTQNGVYGCKVVGPNGNSIFLPAAGYMLEGTLYSAGSDGDYWSSSLDSDGPYGAYFVDFNSGYVGWDYINRRYGRSVRPVCQ